MTAIKEARGKRFNTELFFKRVSLWNLWLASFVVFAFGALFLFEKYSSTAYPFVQRMSTRQNTEKEMLNQAIYNNKDSGVFQNITGSYSISAGASSGSDIMLVAYMRTGSTFLGEVLGWRSDVFYWFEPLRKNRQWNYLRGRDLLCHSLKPSCDIIADDESRSSARALQLLEDIFHCRIKEHINKTTDINYFDSLTPPSWRRFVQCTKSSKKIKMNEECLTHLLNSCDQAKHRLVKILRIDLATVSELLEINHRLKIVQLFRDPRGSMNSHLRTPWYAGSLKSVTNIDNDARVLCSRLINDITIGKKLQKLYPERVMLLQYEDFDVLDSKIQLVYKFLELEAPSHVKGLDKNSDADDSKKTGFHPFTFRKQLPWKVVKILNKHCSKVYQELGLRQFDNEEDYTNSDISVIKDRLPFALIK